jgi:hypothetical protein
MAYQNILQNGLKAGDTCIEVGTFLPLQILYILSYSGSENVKVQDLSSGVTRLVWGSSLITKDDAFKTCVTILKNIEICIDQSK